MAGIPAACPNMTNNRGIQAVATVANQIRAGEIEIGIGGGFESMSHYKQSDLLIPDQISDQVFEQRNAANVLTSMGITSENVAAKYGVTRE